MNLVIGDKVEVIENFGRFEVGMTGKVVEIDEHGRWKISIPNAIRMPFDKGEEKNGIYTIGANGIENFRKI